MSQPPEPVRWLEEPSALPEDVLAEMRAYTAREPSSGELLQIRAGLAAQGVQPRAVRPDSLVQASGSLQPKLLILTWLGTALLVFWQGMSAAPATPAASAPEAAPAVVVAPAKRVVEPPVMPE